MIGIATYFSLLFGKNISHKMKTTILSLSLMIMTLLGFAQEINKNNPMSENIFTELDKNFFRVCLDLAEKALKAGDQPFGSILVNADNKIIAKARNRVNEQGVLAHPEIELAEWAVQYLTLDERHKTTMYTTGEHCPMCAGAHAWAQIGKLYYLSSAKQLGKWLEEFGIEPAPITFIPSETIIKDMIVKGPAEGKLVKRIKKMHKRYYKNKN